MKNKHLFVSALLLAMPLSLMAEDRVIKGYVVDAATGEPVPGAIVSVVGATASVLTQESGDYMLTVPDNAVAIWISSPDHHAVLQSLVAGEEQKKSVLYSVTFNDAYAHALDASPTQYAGHDTYSSAVNVKEELQMQAGGALYSKNHSGTPGIGSVLFIQGLNSLNANAQPLVVVDGVILEQQYGNTMLHQGFFNDILSNINPLDIERVTVLRNGTALYGARGANGVLLIETKRSHSMSTKITATVSAGVTTEPKYYDMMDANQYRGYASELLKGTGTRVRDFRFLNEDPGYYYYKQYHNNTDWKEKVYRNAFNQNYSISVEGGDDVAMYDLSVGFVKQESTLEYNDMNRINVRFNSDINMTDRLHVKFDASFSNIKRDLRDDGAPLSYDEGTPSAPSFLAYAKSPFISPFSYGNGELSKTYLDVEDETYLDEAMGLISAVSNYNYKLGNPWAFNQYAEDEVKNHFENSLMNVTITPSYKFSKHFNLASQFSYSLVNTNNKYYLPYAGVPTFYVSNVSAYHDNMVRSLATKQNSVQSDTRLDWKQKFGDHDLSAFLGARLNWEMFSRNEQWGYDTGDDNTPFMSAALKDADNDGCDNRWRSIDYYLQACYNYQNRFLLQGGVTASASSRFGKDAKGGVKLAGVSWGMFPSIQGTWVMTNESWLSSFEPLNLLRLSVGYDVSGNDGVDVNAARSFFAASPYLATISGLSFANIGNTEIAWETTGRFNVGVQSMFLNNRIGLDANFFSSKTKNLLTLQSLGFLSGIETNWGNGGELKNTGFDVTVQGKAFVSRDWSWQVGLSVGHYKNEITQLAEGQTAYNTEVYGATVRTEVGQAANLFYGYQTKGVYSTTDQAKNDGRYVLDANGVDKHYFGAGDMIFVDQDDNQVIDAKDRVVIGDPNPDFYGNIFSKLSWKNLSLDVNFNYSVGNDAFNYMRSQLEGGSRFMNQTTAMTQRWQMEGQETSVPRISFQDPMGNSRFSDRWIEDASYLRLKSVTLSYRLPLNMQFIQGLEFWVQGNNLYTWTKYLGSDPEFAATNSIIGQGIDLGYLGQSRGFVAGIKINL